MRKSLIALFCLLLCPLSHGEQIPTEELSHENAFKGFKLSPDGKAVAYSETIKGENILRILNLETGEKIGINLIGNRRSQTQGSYFTWISDERLVYSTPRGFEAVNRDGSKGRTIGNDAAAKLSGGQRLKLGAILYFFRNDKDQRILGTSLNVTVTDGTSYGHAIYDWTRPGVAMMNGTTGTVVLKEENPGHVTRWLVTSEGETKAAQEIDGTKYRVIYRDYEEMAWKALPGMDWDDPQVRPLGFGQNDQVLYVSRLNKQGRWAVYPYDLHTKEFGPVILEDDEYDIIPQTDASWQAGLIYTPDLKRLLGIRYTTAYPRVYWLDEGLGQVQAGLDQALKGKVNSIVSMSDDLQKLIILSASDRDPGTYYFFDREKQALSVLMKSTPWIKPEQMSKMRPLKFKARDGVTIHGYMNLPVDKKPKDLPLIVLNDGGYWVRNTWYFDRTAQFFANRGYAVLRINARGTTGYGDAFKQLAYRKTDESIADLADGVKWAISKGLVDAKRVAVVGEGTMSGIRTLTALALNPEVYACGIVNSPYTDWKEVIHRDRLYRDERVRMHERVGDPNDPNDPLSRMSPIQMADQIKAPVLITVIAKIKPIYYPFIKDMVSALEDSGSEVVLETEYKAKYGFENYGKWLEDTVVFMEKHMPANQ